MHTKLYLSLLRSHLFMAPPSFPPAANGCLIILYASQTGNAMDVAQRVGLEAKRGGCLDVDVLSMDCFNPVRPETLKTHLHDPFCWTSCETSLAASTCLCRVACQIKGLWSSSCPPWDRVIPQIR